MFVVCLLVLIGIYIVPKLTAAQEQSRWDKTPAEEKWNSYLENLRRMNWDTFEFGTYHMKTWHYDEVIKFLDRIEQGLFPIDEWEYSEIDGKMERGDKITLDINNVEQYIDECHKMYVDLNLEKLFDVTCRSDMRNGIVTIDRQRMTIAEARMYARKKVDEKIAEIHGFRKKDGVKKNDTDI